MVNHKSYSSFNILETKLFMSPGESSTLDTRHELCADKKHILQATCFSSTGS
jgi:hypothetical protein